MVASDSTKLHNRLWQARKRSRLAQKQIASLLKHSTPDQVSRFEKGLRLPSLENALRLEIILRVPVRLLFPDLYRKLKAEIEEAVKTNTSLKRFYERPLLDEDFGEYCTHAERLHAQELSPDEEAALRRHVIRLAKLIANR